MTTIPMRRRHCEWCGRFVSAHHPRTVRYCYDINPESSRTVYSLATATKLVRQLLCTTCAPSARDFRLREAERGHGVVIDRRLPGGWAKCSPGEVR